MTDGFAIEVARVQTRSIEVVLRGVRRLYGEASNISGQGFRWDAQVARVGPLTLAQGAFHDSPIHGSYCIERHLVAMTRALDLEVRTGSATFRARPGSTAVAFSPGRAGEVTSPVGLRTLNLILEPSFLVEQMEALTGERVHGDITLDSTLDLHSGVGAYLFQASQYMADELEQDPGRLPPLLAASICESLVRAILSSPIHSHAHLLHKPPPPSSRTIVRRVEEYMDANAGTPIVGSHLAHVAGTSVASIDVAFQRHRGMSPGAFLRHRRLERARHALLQDPSLSTAHAGQMAGYLGVAAFEAAYFKAFGETPAQTRQKASLGGRTMFNPAPAAHPAERFALLSPREQEVGSLVAKGLLNKQIAGALGISEKMVQKHRGRAMQKLGLASAADLVRLWERTGK